MRKHIKSSNFKETEIHFQIEWVQSRSTNTETFDATVELKKITQVLLKTTEVKKVPVLVMKSSLEKESKKSAWLNFFSMRWSW